MKNYIVATIKPWNIAAYKKHRPSLPGDWHLVDTPQELLQACEQMDPRYIFFPHWSWRVPDCLLEKYECVCFHMTDLPYGRGGSPLQNLIVRGHKHTMLTALRMSDEIDGGPVYAKQPLSLEGSAQDIYERAAGIVFNLIERICLEEPIPAAQSGEVVSFSRRKPEQSELPDTARLESIYDHIRMLDAPTYPAAFVRHGRWRIELSQAQMEHNTINGRFTLRLENDDDE